MALRKINYLNNRDLLVEIHKSKSSFCSFVADEYHQYDIILTSIDRINLRTIAEAKRNRAKRLTQQAYERAKAVNPKIRLSQCEIKYKTIVQLSIIKINNMCTSLGEAKKESAHRFCIIFI